MSALNEVMASLNDAIAALSLGATDGLDSPSIARAGADVAVSSETTMVATKTAFFIIDPFLPVKSGSHCFFGIPCEWALGFISLWFNKKQCQYDEGMTARILVVDDDTAVREMVCDALELAGYETFSANDGQQALSVLQKDHADLVVSDINMPKVDGFELVEKLRSRGNQTPVVFLTARNEKPDIGKGFRVGADDYISKPFGIEELVLRVAAILRRSMASESSKMLSIGPIEVDVDAVTVKLNGKSVSLSPTEFKLLLVLIENRSRVVSRQFLLDEVWDMGFSESATVVDTYISYLRKKLHTPTFEGIRTVRGFGFQITDK